MKRTELRQMIKEELDFEKEFDKSFDTIETSDKKISPLLDKYVVLLKKHIELMKKNNDSKTEINKWEEWIDEVNDFKKTMNSGMWW